MADENEAIPLGRYRFMLAGVAVGVSAGRGEGRSVGSTVGTSVEVAAAVGRLVCVGVGRDVEFELHDTVSRRKINANKMPVFL